MEPGTEYRNLAQQAQEEERERVLALLERHLVGERRCEAKYGRSLVANHAYTAETLELLKEDIRNGARTREES